MCRPHQGSQASLGSLSPPSILGTLWWERRQAASLQGAEDPTTTTHAPCLSPCPRGTLKLSPVSPTPVPCPHTHHRPESSLWGLAGTPHQPGQATDPQEAPVPGASSGPSVGMTSAGVQATKSSGRGLCAQVRDIGILGTFRTRAPGNGPWDPAAPVCFQLPQNVLQACGPHFHMTRFPLTGKARLVWSFTVSPSHSTAPRSPDSQSHARGNLGGKDGPGTVLSSRRSQSGADRGGPSNHTSPSPRAPLYLPMDSKVWTWPLQPRGQLRTRLPSLLSPPTATPPIPLSYTCWEDRCMTEKSPPTAALFSYTSGMSGPVPAWCLAVKDVVVKPHGHHWPVAPDGNIG